MFLQAKNIILNSLSLAPKPHWISRIVGDDLQTHLKLIMPSWMRNWFSHYQTKIWRQNPLYTNQENQRENWKNDTL